MQFHFPTTVHSPVQLQEVGDNRTLCIGLHGYGETAQIMQERLLQLGLSNTLCCSPQALHPFYLKNKTVGYNWMASEMRDIHIMQNNEYLQNIFQSLQKKYNFSEIILIGFSQGASMAWRAAEALHNASIPTKLIAVAGDIPPEAALLPELTTQVLIARASEDSFYTLESQEKDVARLTQSNTSFQILPYTGKHLWSPELIKPIQTFLA